MLGSAARPAWLPVMHQLGCCEGSKQVNGSQQSLRACMASLAASGKPLAKPDTNARQSSAAVLAVLPAERCQQAPAAAPRRLVRTILGQPPCEDSCSQQGSWAAGRWPPAGGLVAWLRLCGHTPDHNAGHGLQQLLTGLFRVPARSEPTKPSPWLYRPRHGLSGGPCGVASRAGVAARFRLLTKPRPCTNSSRRRLSDALLGAAIRSRRFGSELPGSHTHILQREPQNGAKSA